MSNRIKESSDSFSTWILFFLSPIFSVIFSIKNFRHPFAKNMIWAFTVFYGLTFVISDKGMDSYRYQYKFLELSRTSLTFSQFTETLYDPESSTADIVDPTIQYVLSRFTDDSRVLFGVYGLIFGFFYSRNLWYLLNRMGPDIKTMVVPLILTFAFLVPIWDLNGFRFNTSMHIFLFGLLPYLYENKKLGLIVSFLTVFVHFSFIFPALILLIYLLLGNRLYLYFIFFVASIFVTEINVEVIGTSIESNLPEVFHTRSSSYIGEDRVEDFRLENPKSAEKLNWYVTGHVNALKWMIYTLLILIFIQRKIFITENKHLLKLMCFTMLMYGCANVSNLVPSGGRFITIANMFSMALIIFCIQRGPKKSFIDTLIPFTIPILILFILVKLRIGFDTLGVFTIFGNPLFLFFFNTDVALINLIK